MEDQGIPFRPCSSPLTSLAWEALHVAYATASVVHAVIWPQKPHHCAKVGISSGRSYHTGLKFLTHCAFHYKFYITDTAELQEENLTLWSEQKSVLHIAAATEQRVPFRYGDGGRIPEWRTQQQPWNSQCKH